MPRNEDRDEWSDPQRKRPVTKQEMRAFRSALEADLVATEESLVRLRGLSPDDVASVRVKGRVMTLTRAIARLARTRQSLRIGLGLERLGSHRRDKIP